MSPSIRDRSHSIALARFVISLSAVAGAEPGVGVAADEAAVQVAVLQLLGTKQFPRTRLDSPLTLESLAATVSRNGRRIPPRVRMESLRHLSFEQVVASLKPDPFVIATAVARLS